MRQLLMIIALAVAVGGVVSCASPSDVGIAPAATADDGSARRVAMDFYIGDLDDPAVMAKYAELDLLIADCGRFWGRERYEGDIAKLKAANPDLKVIGFFRSKCVRVEWGTEAYAENSYLRDLFEASRPHWSFTTAGDTLQDWPGVALFNTLDPLARRAMLDVLASYQRSSVNRFDGIYWDYFNTSLWISPDVDGMTGEPDMDGDGVPHWDDQDEKDAFAASQIAAIDEVRSALGEDFIQVANGWRALVDSTFAARLDGMFYELFPSVGFVGGEHYRMALDPANENNLFAARNWPRTRNGGPWLILSNKSNSIRYFDESGDMTLLDLGDVNRAFALLSGASYAYYDLSGRHAAGVPSVTLDLGAPLAGVQIDGEIYTREFERGRIELEFDAARHTLPFSFTIWQGGQVAQRYELPSVYP